MLFKDENLKKVKYNSLKCTINDVVKSARIALNNKSLNIQSNENCHKLSIMLYTTI